MISLKPANIEKVKLTDFSLSGGCGCKVPSNLLSGITDSINVLNDLNIMTDFHDNEDAAIYKINDKQCLVYSLDFFTPIVDDPYTFGRIAAANALSDVYAKGIQPNLSLSILGFPKEFGETDVPAKIIKGASDLCKELGVNIVGGHTIYNQQVIFGLSVVGIADIKNIKRNNTANEGDLLYLTKPIGSGILSTAMKKCLIKEEDEKEMIRFLTIPNSIGQEIGKMDFVSSMTDVTGFGLLGHLVEICRASNTSAEIKYSDIRQFPNLQNYIDLGVVTSGGTNNWSNYKKYVNSLDDYTSIIMSDPQSNGGLLISVNPEYKQEFESFLADKSGIEFAKPIGSISKKSDHLIIIK